MPMIYKVREPMTKHTVYSASHPQARKFQMGLGDNATLEKLEYNYKWQLVVMLNEAYKQGAEDVSNGMD